MKGGIGYWNKIRRDLPDRFRRIAEIERKVGDTCLKDEHGRIWLDELDPTRGDDVAPIVPDCSLFCAIEFQNIEDPQTAKVMHGEIGINETKESYTNNMNHSSVFSGIGFPEVAATMLCW